MYIVFFIERIHKPGYKDIDHILPFIHMLGMSEGKHKVVGIIYGYSGSLINSTDPRVRQMLRLNDVQVVNPFERYDRFFKIISTLMDGRLKGVVKIFRPFIMSLIGRRYEKVKDKIKWEEVLGDDFVNADMPIVLNRAPTEKVGRVFRRLKEINQKCVWMVIPHGTTVCDNKMLQTTDMDRNESVVKKRTFEYIDYHLCTAERDLLSAVEEGMLESKGHVIGSPRYCREWITLKRQLKLDGPLPVGLRKAKVKILFLIPKKFINIFTEELIRTIEFIAKYDEINLIINRDSTGYPNLSKKLFKKNNVMDCLISGEYSTGALIDWADVVFHAGTGVIFESFVKEKITVLPRYLTCNTLICEQYNAGWTLKNRDELREFCNMVVRSLKEAKRHYEREYGVANQEYIADYVQGNSDSVRDNIVSVFREIQGKKSMRCDKLYEDKQGVS